MPSFLIMTVLGLLCSQTMGVTGKTCRRTSPARALHHLNITVTHKTTRVSLKRHLYGFGPECMNPNISDSAQKAISEIASCPWILRTHRDSSRIPHTISYVQCKCKNCRHQYKHGGLCQEVTWEFSVLKRVCTRDGTTSMQRVYQRFPVACVCVPRMSAHRDKA